MIDNNINLDVFIYYRFNVNNCPWFLDVSMCFYFAGNIDASLPLSFFNIKQRNEVKVMLKNINEYYYERWLKSINLKTNSFDLFVIVVL